MVNVQRLLQASMRPAATMIIHRRTVMFHDLHLSLRSNPSPKLCHRALNRICHPNIFPFQSSPQSLKALSSFASPPKPSRNPPTRPSSRPQLAPPCNSDTPAYQRPNQRSWQRGKRQLTRQKVVERFVAEYKPLLFR